VILVAEGRGRRLTLRPGVKPGEVAEAARVLAQRLVESYDGRRDPVVETVDGIAAVTSSHAAALGAAGFRPTNTGLRYYAPPR